MDLASYILSRKYTDSVCNSLGSLKGAPCVIKSTTDTGEGTVITFEWTGTSGTTETDSITIKNGKSIINASVDDSNNLFLTLSDNSVINVGTITTLQGNKGNDGYSPTITENINNDEYTYKLDITTKDGSFTTPNLKGGNEGIDLNKIEIVQGKL